MPDYEYGRVKILAEKLAKAGVAADVADQIMAGGEAILKTTPPVKKADWMQGAMDKMDTLLDEPTRRAVREACACCLGGKRLELSKRIAKNHATLEERIAAANETRLVFGHSVTVQEDGRIMVLFQPEDLGQYRCVCIHKPTNPMSETYCYCCGGHIKHHLQIALGVKLECTVRSSALASGGTKPCSFLYKIV